ncbi:MAG: 5'/3'-nucleotidase SurE [Moorellales bacterium]
MRILLSNDDGVLAEGLHVLRKRLSRQAEVYVVAPDHERSACGHSITLHRPLRANRVMLDGATDPVWAVNGTPADCVKLALEVLLPEPPDLVISGINLGPNLGTDVLYSGTVSAALEGAIEGVPSIAVSLDGEDPALLPFAADFTALLCRRLLDLRVKPHTLLNVNLPNLPPERIAGVEITTLGWRRYVNAVHRREDPRGRPYYWIAGDIQDDTELAGTDVAALAAGKITITPIHFDLTDYRLVEELKGWGLGSDLESALLGPPEKTD